MTKQRRNDIARSLQFWATCDKKETHDIDERLRHFLAERGELIEALKKTEEEMKTAELRRLQLTSSLLNAWFVMTDETPKLKTASGVPADDLMFWNRLMSVSPETYEFLQPRWERLERLLVSAKLRDHNDAKKERSERVARLLNDGVSTRKNARDQGEEDAQGKKKGEAGPG